MQHSGSEKFTRVEDTDDNRSHLAIRPGYVFWPGQDKTYLVLSVLAEQEMPLATMEMPDLSGIWDNGAGVSRMVVLIYCGDLIEFLLLHFSTDRLFTPNGHGDQPGNMIRLYSTPMAEGLVEAWVDPVSFIVISLFCFS